MHLISAYCDAPTAWQVSFQEPATPVMEGIINLHHEIFFYLIIIFSLVGWMLFQTLTNYNEASNPKPNRFSHHTALEVVWTLLPAVVLISISVPSFALLYAMDEVIDPAITVKAIGHQWYWSYEYSDYSSSEEDSIVFDSYMIPESDLEEGQLRLLEVDNRMVIPANTHVRVITTSTDVIHSWAVPSFGIKIDAIPGRLNQVSLFVERPGVYYGQCSEICGVNHAFMPIVVEVVDLDSYLDWVGTQA